MTDTLSNQYRSCALDIASKASLGLAVGAASAFLFFRNPSARKVVTATGFGFGVGHAWATSSHVLAGHPLYAFSFLFAFISSSVFRSSLRVRSAGGPAFPLSLPGMDLIAFNAPHTVSAPAPAAVKAAPAAKSA
jgi:hypothetical protein